MANEEKKEDTWAYEKKKRVYLPPETTKVQELSEEDFLHALVWSYNEMIDQIKELMDSKKLPDNLLTRTSLKCHKTFVADFIKRHGEMKDVQFHF